MFLIKLLEDITTGRNWKHAFCPNEYKKGDVIAVEPASNLPNDSSIAFWVAQDGWEDDSYGFPVYKNTDYVHVQ